MVYIEGNKKKDPGRKSGEKILYNPKT